MIRLILEPILMIGKEFGLLLQLTKRNVELRHKGSYFGLIWAVFQPLLLLCLYVSVFGFIFKGSFSEGDEANKLEYGLGIFVGLSFLHFFSEILSLACTCITGNPNFVKKVVFPLHILPLSIVGTAFIHFLISLVLIVLGSLFIKTSIDWNMLWLLAYIPPMLLLGAGLSLLLSALTVYVKDIIQLSSFLVLTIMFSSAIFYPVSKIPEEFWKIMKYNPILHLVENSRRSILWGEAVDLRMTVYTYGVSIIIFYLGFNIFKKLRDGFADVI